jgi:hypothetical protein
MAPALRWAVAGLAAVLFTGPVVAQPLGAAAAPAERATRHALVIGIGTYTDPAVPALKGVVHDLVSARRMAAAMGVPEANITVLRDEVATAERIRQEIDALGRRVKDGDRVFVYYSGHGTRWFDEAVKAEGCTEGLLATDGRVLSNVELGERLAPLAARADKMLVFYDACFSGGVAGEPFRTRSFVRSTGTPPGEQVTPKFTRVGAPEACAQPSNFRTRSLAQVLQPAQPVAQNVVHIAASRPDEVSFDSSSFGGYATVHWRDCLLGQARDLDGSGAITVDEITRCAQARITPSLAGQPGILGQQMTIAGNANFVPAWMGAAFTPVSSPTAAPTAVNTAPARAASPAEILAEVHGQRDGSRRVVATVRQPLMKIGRDTLDIDVTPSRDGYLYVALAGSDGRSLYLLYPNALATDNRVQAGRRVSLPGTGGWEIVAAGPPGPETLLVMVSDAPRDLRGLAQAPAGPFMQTLLDAQGRARLQAVLGNGTPPAGCGQPGQPSCSDAFGAALLKVETLR